MRKTRGDLSRLKYTAILNCRLLDERGYSFFIGRLCVVCDATSRVYGWEVGHVYSRIYN
jgi:hypothetical protein